MRKKALWAGAGTLALLLMVLVVLANLDWNRAKPWLNRQISTSIGRPFTIEGDLSISWKKAAQPEAGWHGWIPWPQLSARDIRVGNPAWSKAETDMATVGQLRLSLNPLLLLQKKILVDTLVLQNPQVNLERLQDGRNNWSFAPTASSAWTVELKTLVLDKGRVHLIDAIRHADLIADIDTLTQTGSQGYGIAWTIRGKFEKQAVSGKGRAGAVLSLQTQAEPYPIELSVRAGKTLIDAEGTLTRPRDLAALDMRLKLSGASMAQLFPLTGVLLPETPAYKTAGHLSATLDRAGGNWIYEKFSGTVGASDLAGTLEFQSRPPRPLLRGEVVSNLLNFSDLAPVIGADSGSSKAERGVANVQPAGKILPAEKFKTDRWRSVDVDVKFTGRRIVRDKALPIDSLVTHVRLKDGVMSLSPLAFGVAGGTLSSDIRLDAREEAIKAEMKMSARGLILKELFPTVQSMHASLGAINGDASLTAGGNSVALLLGSSSGEVKATMTSGTISKLLLEEIGLNIGSVVLTRIFGDKEIKVRCAAGDFAVSNGVMQTRSFVLDTDQSTINIEGRIDLAREQLDLTLKPVSKHLRLITFNGPLYMTGSFASPSVTVDKAAVALKAVGVVALALIAPIAAIIPLTTIGKQDDADCHAAPAAKNTRRDK